MAVNIGFIGVGTIASALVTGFCSKKDKDHNIILSPRNAVRASELAAMYENVTVAGSNQEVLDKSEWVVLAVVPQIAEEVIRPLSFREDHRVISLLAGWKLREAAGLTGKTRTLVRMIPLPFAAMRIGPITIYPEDRDVEELFSPLGEIVRVDKEKQIEVVQTITALASSYFGLLWKVVKWGEREGLAGEEAVNYTTSFFEALTTSARQVKDGDIGRLSEEMTPGGLNEMALISIREQQGFEPWIQALDSVLGRLRK